jgi:pimeloyl-ACP methyl ester carboxylesterase
VTEKGPFWAVGHEGQDDYRYYLYEPGQPTPAEAPVVLFLHGYNGLQPKSYGAWIEHLVKKGYTVVWAQYQASNLTFPWFYSLNARTAWIDALDRLDTEPSHVRPERDYKGHYKTAIVGHSAGAYVGANIAAIAADEANGIPEPYAVLAFQPGGLNLIPKGPLSKMDDDTKFIVVVGNHDDVVCKSTAVFLWNEVTSVPEANRDFLLVRSDNRGSPEVIAHHYFPPTFGFTAEAEGLDVLDFFVTFKLSVGALRCAWKGVDCEYALGHGSPEQLYMGEWSDGQPVKPMERIENPNQLETVCEDPAPGGACSP